MPRTETVTFNVGGHRYEISQSLLNQYPQSILATSASKTWMEDDESEVFFERDGSTFRYILNYLRDGRITLPLSEPKDNFIRELEYFCVEYEEEAIDDWKCNVESYAFQLSTFILPSLRKVLEDIQRDVDERDMDANDAISKGKRLALFCIEEFFRQQHSKLMSHSVAPGIDITLLPRNASDKDLIQSCYINGNVVSSTANDCLQKVGLKVKNLCSKYESCVTVVITESSGSNREHEKDLRVAQETNLTPVM